VGHAPLLKDREFRGLLALRITLQQQIETELAR